MRLKRPGAVLLAAIAAVVSLAACGASGSKQANVPDNVTQLMSTPVGKALAASGFGYTPVVNLYDQKNKVDGAIYVNCGQPAVNLTACADDLNRQASMQHPNVYVVDNKVVKLQGPYVNTMSTLSYWVAVPDAYQKFDKLSKAEQRGLLGIMPQIKSAIPQPGTNNGKHVKVLVKAGNKEVEVTAWVS